MTQILVGDSVSANRPCRFSLGALMVADAIYITSNLNALVTDRAPFVPTYACFTSEVCHKPVARFRQIDTCNKNDGGG